MTVEPPKPNDESDDGFLRRAIESDDPESDAPPPVETETVPAVPARSIEGPGAVIGRYRLLQQIGEGGFGTVYMAEQKQPVKRKVALKIIKLGMDTKQVIARFEAERQALAMMDHPNIARVLDAGATETGRPFFVMELVKGVPITEYCDTESLRTRDRLDLFIDVCRAVQHAHQKGIIHRDIKPSNVMITLHDGKPVPKVIDFGIAKATNRDLTDKTLFTEYHQLIGTPAYMSPEQAEMSGLDLDTRSDIYSLGVLLYELLTGTTPVSNKRFRGMGLGEIQHVIREEAPQKPSTRLSDMSRGRTPGNGQSGTTSDKTSIQYITNHRRTDIAGLRREISGDLDWIIMKCLEKDRSRRYETANGLARDVERHLNDEPVAAGPPSQAYRLRKAIRRNKGVFVGIATVFAALLAGVIVSTSFYFKTEAQRRLVDEERLSARVSERRAMRERDESIAATRQAKAETTALAELVATFAAGKTGEEVSKVVGEHLAETPAPEGLVRAAMIKKNIALGHIAEARQHIEAIMAIEPLKRRRPLLRALLPRTIDQVFALALGDQARYAEAEVLWRMRVEVQRRTLGQEHPTTLNAMNALVIALSRQGRYAEAEALCRKALAIRRRVSGEKHLATLWLMNNLAHKLLQQGRYAEAEPIARKCVELSGSLFGEKLFNTMQYKDTLAEILLRRGKLAEAEDLYREKLSFDRQRAAQNPRAVNLGLAGMAETLLAKGEPTEATALAEEGLRVVRAGRPEGHPEVALYRIILGACLTAQGQYERAQTLILAGYDTSKAVQGASGYLSRQALRHLVRLYESWDAAAPGEGYAQKAADWRAKLSSEDGVGASEPTPP